MQAAQHHARAAFGDDRIDAFAPLGVVESDGQVDVTLEGLHGPIKMRLRETFSDPIITMCLARTAGPVKQWKLIKIRGGG